jgi:DNA invertase Pin-like site-specific DNA recombinase
MQRHLLRSFRRSLPLIAYFLLRSLLLTCVLAHRSGPALSYYEPHVTVTNPGVHAAASHRHRSTDPLHDILAGWFVEAPPTAVRLFARRKRRRLGGRLDRKPQERSDIPGDWRRRAFERLAFIYMRFSTREQRENNAYSYERQADLKKLAVQHGAKAKLTSDEIKEIKARADYPGWYQDGQIVVEERDLVGVSGRKGQEDRPGLAHMISLIERDMIGVVYVVDVSRLFRDEYLVGPAQFAKLCAQKGVYIATEGKVFDLTLETDYDYFIFQAQYASKELKMIKSRLGGSRRTKANMGKYAGGPMPLGYVVLRDEGSGRLDEYMVYEPHARIIRIIFQKMLELRRIQAVAGWCNQNGIIVPPFEPGWEYMHTRSALCLMKAVTGSDGGIIGYRILRSTASYILDNPMYVGQIYREGHLVRNDPRLAIVDNDTFDAVQKILECNQPRSHRESTAKLLAGLLYCTAHDEEPYTVYSAGRDYHCAYEWESGLKPNRCFTIKDTVFDIPVSAAVLSVLSCADCADQIIRQLERELGDRQSRAQSYKQERKRLERERDNFVESIAFFHSREQDPRQREKLLEEIYQRINEREIQLQELARKELAPFEDVLSTAEVSMVREFLSDLDTRWDEIPNEMRNNFLRVILNRILVQEEGDHFNVCIIWRSGYEQRLIIFRPATSARKRRWTEQEKALIREHYTTASREELERMLPGREWREIQRHAHHFGLKRGRPDRTGTKNPHWTPEEDQVLRDYDECRIAYTEMLEALSHRSYGGIRRRAGILGIDLTKYRIVWRFVDTFQETSCSPV